MATLSEKILWPIVGIFIFAVLAGFYIDDRRRLVEEGMTGSTEQQASTQQKSSPSTKNKNASSNSGSNHASSKSTKQTASSNQATEATSMSIDEYLAQSTSERNQQLEANVAHHQGFSGGIDEYLSGSESKATKNIHTKANSGSRNTQQAAGATSMSMEEYQAKTSDKSQNQSQQQVNTSAYHGGIDGYLAKFGDDAQTKLSTNNEKPFNKKEHMGFHGSYEEYAKKYN